MTTTAPEALRQLRELATRFRVQVPSDTHLLDQVIDCFREVIVDGDDPVSPIVELRIRRFRRLAEYRYDESR